MPLYDYQCESCGYIEEHYVSPDERVMVCSQCGGEARRIFSPGNNHPNEDAGWIRSVLEVVDKEGGPHCQEFLKHPTRTNYQNWMRGEGLRHWERGERPQKKHFDEEKHTQKLWNELQQGRRIEVRR